MSVNHPKPSGSGTSGQGSSHAPGGSGGGTGTGAVHIPSIEEKNKQIQQEALMEKIRAKYRQKPKSYDEIKKSIRMYFIEKHYPLDPVCKATLQTVLDKLQHYIKVNSRHGLVERLESLSRQLGLKFMEDQQTLFISTDMFYVEILLDTEGKLSDVKVHHECKSEQPSTSPSSSSSADLLNCLKAGDFADFTVQLEGLSSIYQLNAEPKVKKKAFVALEAMETDIYNLYQQQLQQHQQPQIDSYQMMKMSSVGLVMQRRGGHPMKLTYFCPPLHLLESQVKGELVDAAASRDYSIEQVMKSPVGLHATLNLEGSSANKLQILPVVSFSSESGLPLELPAYASLTQNNSMLIPATYVLRLGKPMPVCIDSLRALGLPGVPSEGDMSVMNLIVQTASRQLIRNIQKGLYVNLPKETHCYFLTDNRRLQGTMLCSLQFTEPAQVPKIIAFLKKQALFYTLLASCVREQQKQYNDMESTIILEVTAVSLNQITVELQHPYEESLATVDFLLEDGEATCTIYCLTNDYEALSQKLTRTVRQVVSIPMVIYKLLKCWDEEHLQKLHGMAAPGAGGSSTSGAAGGFSGGSGLGGGATNFGQFALDSSSVSGEGSSGVGGGLGGSGGFSSVSNLKMESTLRSLADAFADSTSAAAAIAGIINLKRETDPQASSSSSSLPLSTSASTSGASNSASTSSAAAKASEHEIADKYKNIWKDKTPNLKHCVSITPIAGDVKAPLQQQQQQVDVQRTGGIEIIPLSAPSSVGTTPSAGSPATTITITPITGGGGGNGAGKDAAKEQKKSTSSGSGSSTKRPHESGSSSSANPSSSSASTSSSSSDNQKEKKRKKKRDDSPMGPPEKIYSRQNSPAGGGITDSSSSSGVVRKFSSPSTSSSSSPKSGVAGMGAALGLSALGQPSARPSPKHSPVYSSPKHSSNTASNSPKSPFGTHSPKHGSSGKPSMSTLKSATAATSLSLSPKAEKSSSGITSSGSTAISLPLALPLPTGPSVSGTTSGAGSGSNPPMMRPVPPLAASSSSQLPAGITIKKDKSSLGIGMGSSSTTSSASSSGVVAAAVAALKSSQQQQQQMKSSVSSLSHLAAGGNLGSYSTPSVAALELNAALRKGMAGSGTGVGPGSGPGMGVAAGAVGAVSLMTSTAASTATIPTTATATISSVATTAAAATVDSSATASGTVGTGTGAAPPPPLAIATSTTTAMATHHQQQLLAAAPHSSDSGSSSSSTGVGANTGGSSEYMVKPSSQEGLKLTIKTGGISSSSSTSSSSSKRDGKRESGPSSSSGSRKTHTGLKPGVNSGPASKKAHALGSSGSGSGSSSSKHLFQKANSSGSLSTKLGGSSSSSTSSGGGGLPLTKSNSTNSFQEHTAPKRRPSMGSGGASGSGSGQRKLSQGGHGSGGSGGMSPAASSGSMSQPPPRFDHHTDMMTILQYASPSMTASMEGFIKGLHNKFQIPKLSQRTATTTATSSSGSTSSTSGAGGGGQTTATSTATTSSSTTSSALQDQQATTDPIALSSGQSTAPTSITAQQSNSGEQGSGDGIDEELLASLAGE
ncbi:mediator of RNA polymerase II transcription subunit 1 isoform X1 [Drosophila sulfurigaster albostrigata]|uniref:mediator of RNA polymerase II transcription subunit 1 isoform X1 n=1 Tax=Drosophila sulfurigaster albostrigata TaxID=89887 RepID=UPI002D21C636|nr:mediator of RNA polymerase II transcription subunit 1 isoform X1 [Drosophila sulfurigaster albostrigata]